MAVKAGKGKVKKMKGFNNYNSKNTVDQARFSSVPTMIFYPPKEQKKIKGYSINVKGQLLPISRNWTQVIFFCLSTFRGEKIVTVFY